MKKTILTGILFLSAAAGFAQTPITREQTNRMVMDTIAARGIQYWMIGIHKGNDPESPQDSLTYFVYEYDESLRATALYLAFSTADGSCRSWTAPTPSDEAISNWDCYSNLPKPKNEALFDFSDWMDNPPTPPRQNVIGGSTPQNYAVIISGGAKPLSNHIHYWNNCSAIYSTLVYVYGYKPENIYAIVSNGPDPEDDAFYRSFDSIPFSPNSTEVIIPGLVWVERPISTPLDLDGDGTNDIHYSASKANISLVFDLLSEKVQEEDHVFIFTTDHGGRTMEGTSNIQLWYDSISSSEFAIEINKLKSKTINIMMAQCYSGGFIPPLATEGRVIATASRHDETSKHFLLKSYDEFVLHWVSAVRGSTPDNVPVNADFNNDGIVSMHEAFLYAKEHDTADETPQYASWPDNLGNYVSLDGLATCPETTLVNATVSSDRTVNGCSVEVSYSTVKSGKKLTINHEISTELGLGFSMEPGSELEIK